MKQVTEFRSNSIMKVMYFALVPQARSKRVLQLAYGKGQDQNIGKPRLSYEMNW